MPRDYIRMTQMDLWKKLEEARKAAVVARREWLDGTGTYREYADLMREWGALKGNYHRWYPS